MGRHTRGEVLSGRARLDEAVRLFCLLLARHVPAPEASLLDGLDPLRRVERVYPATGGELAWPWRATQRGSRVRCCDSPGASCPTCPPSLAKAWPPWRRGSRP